MNKKFQGGVNIGTSSALVAFVLLCLVTFAALTFLSANSDYRLSKQTAQRTTEYYEANKMAELYMANVEGLLSKSYSNSAGEAADFDSIPELFSDNDFFTVTANNSSVFISYSVTVNSTQDLYIMLKCNYPDNSDSSLFHIEHWNTVITNSLSAE